MFMSEVRRSGANHLAWNARRFPGAKVAWIMLNLLVVGVVASVVFWLPYQELLWLCFVLSALVLLLFGIRRLTPVSVLTWFLLTYSGLYYIHPLLFALTSDELAGRASFPTYVFLTLAGVHLFLIGYLLTNQRSRSILINPRPITIRLQLVGLLIWGLVALGWLGIGLRVFSFGSLATALSASRVALKQGAYSLLSEYFFLFFSPAFFLLPTYLKVKRGVTPWLAVASLVVAEVLLFYLTRVRTYLVAHAISVLCGLYFTYYIPQSHKNRRKALLSGGHFVQWLTRQRRRYFVYWSVAMVVVALAAMSLRFIRGYLEPGVTGRWALSVVDVIALSVRNGDLGYTRNVLDVIEYVPARHDFLYGQSYWRLLLVLVPRSVYPHKPPNTQQIVGSWFKPEVEVYSLPPGIMGDAYINFGLWGILVFLGIGLVYGRLDRVTGVGSFIFNGVSFVQVFHWVRGGFTNPVLQLIFLGLVAYVIDAILTVRRK